MANYRENCLKLADYLVTVQSYNHDEFGSCNSPGCAWGWAAYSGKFGLIWDDFGPRLPDKEITESMKFLFGHRSHEEIFHFLNRDHIHTKLDAAKELRTYADKYFPAEPSRELKSGT